MRTRQLDFLQVCPSAVSSPPFWVLPIYLPVCLPVCLTRTALHIPPLQFYWQDYSNKGYMTTLRYLQDMQREGHIRALGLVNFDAVHTDEICTQLGPGSIVSNQVQVCVHLCPCPTAGGRGNPIKKKNSDVHAFIMIQFSLIDTRPLHGMADVCEKHNIKLLTYGTFVRVSLSSVHRLPAYPISPSSPFSPSLLPFRLPFPFWEVWRFSRGCVA